MTGGASTLQSLLRDVVRVDLAQVSFVTALRNAVGVVVPLAVGAATGQTLAGLTICIGALNVAFSDRPGPYRTRAAQMLLTSLSAALAVFIGSVTGATAWLAVALAAAWGFGGGLLVALGPAATQVGLTGIILLIVFGNQPHPPDRALAIAALVLGGGLLQVALSVGAWPVRRYGPQRAALAALFRQLAADTRAPSAPTGAPAATSATTAARAALATTGADHGTEGEALRLLLDEGEQIRLELLALGHARDLLRVADGHTAVLDQIGAVEAAAGTVLDALADGLAAGRPPADATAPLQRIEAVARSVHVQPPLPEEPAATATAATAHAGLAALATRLEALSDGLRAAVEIATQGSAAGAEAVERTEEARPRALRLRAPLAILRANLTLRSAACRHAVRLACCLAVADGLARGLALPRGYWVALTAAIVLKPDFAATFTRGLGRVAGTLLGLGVATALVYVLFGSLADRVVLVGVLMFAIRSLGPANYGLLVVAVTALVVVLTSFAGARPETTIVERGVDTVIGGALALAAYAAWPTWERTQTPSILADLLDAYRGYFTAVMAGYLNPSQRDLAAMAAARNAARLARSNAEASLDRLRGEPRRSTEDLDRADGLLASSHRFAHGAMALEADLSAGPVPASPALQTFVDDVDAALQVLALSLRDPSAPAHDVPDLRTDIHALAAAGAGVSTPDDRYRLAVIMAEAERIADSITTMARLCGSGHDRHGDAQPPASAASAAGTAAGRGPSGFSA